jgi:cell division protein FtsL
MTVFLKINKTIMKQLLLTFALLAVQLASAQTTDYDTNRGFIHPGGLHTQADFDP